MCVKRQKKINTRNECHCLYPIDPLLSLTLNWTKKGSAVDATATAFQQIFRSFSFQVNAVLPIFLCLPFIPCRQCLFIWISFFFFSFFSLIFFFFFVQFHCIYLLHPSYYRSLPNLAHNVCVCMPLHTSNINNSVLFLFLFFCKFLLNLCIHQVIWWWCTTYG